MRTKEKKININFGFLGEFEYAEKKNKMVSVFFVLSLDSGIRLLTLRFYRNSLKTLNMSPKNSVSYRR